MSDDLTVIGPDGIRRSYDEHYDTMRDVEQDPTGAHQAIQRQHSRIEELEAKLAKAMEALRFYAEGEWPKDYPGGVLFAAGDDTPEFKTHIDYGDKARTTLAELTGGKDE